MISIVTIVIIIVTKTIVVPQLLDVLFISVALQSSSHLYQPTKRFAGTAAVLYATQLLATTPLASKLWSSSMLMSTCDPPTACLPWKGREKKDTRSALQCLRAPVHNNCSSVWKWIFSCATHSATKHQITKPAVDPENCGQQQFSACGIS